MAGLAKQMSLEVPTSSHQAKTARNFMLSSNNKKHLFQRRDTPMTLNIVSNESSKSPKKFSPKFQASFEEQEPQEEESTKDENSVKENST